ncbi:MAG TPA: FHA domain-containing protein [Candidatus Obscuribacterales bacterium]
MCGAEQQAALDEEGKSFAERMEDLFSLPGKSAPKGPPAGAVLINKSTNERYPLTQSVSKIGRDQTNSVALTKDSYISRHHAWILFIKGSYWVEDLGSTNGTLLNGEILNERKQIFPGDCLKLGRTELLFELGQS